MYRCGWASKKNQQRVLAIWIERPAFDCILSKAYSVKVEIYMCLHYQTNMRRWPNVGLLCGQRRETITEHPHLRSVNVVYHVYGGPAVTRR